QALEYAFHIGVPSVVLRDGRTWSFYLPAEEGSYEERRARDVLQPQWFSWQRLLRIGLSLLGSKDFLHEGFEARLATEIIKHRIDLNQIDIMTSAFAVRSFHLVNRTFFVAQGQIQQRKAVGTDVTRLGLFS